MRRLISKQLCHMSSKPVGNALFKPVLQCVSRYTATRLVLHVRTLLPVVAAAAAAAVAIVLEDER